MAPPFLNTPRTDVNETLMSPDKRFGFDSEMASFVAPANGDQLFPNNGARGVFMTPSGRAPLARRRNLNAKPEFTPLLKSAAKNRMFRDGHGKENPDVDSSRLRMSITASSPAFPDHSMMVDSTSMTNMDHTPVIHESSSSMSTPIPAMPRKGELGLNGDGNILTLKEQEAKLEKIDKENFGLKLKIHFLEENLKRTGPEFNQQTIKENTELKTNKVMLERDIKKYMRQLKQGEIELEQYRLQLEQYIEKVKRRHIDEALRDELDRYKELSERRAQELEELKKRFEERNAHGAGDQDEEALHSLREQIDDLEAELKDKQEVIEEREDQIDELKANFRDNQGDDDEKDDLIESQAAEIEQLRDALRKSDQEKSKDRDEEIDALREDHEQELRILQERAEAAERAKKEQLQEFSIRLQKRSDDYETQISTMQSRLNSLEQSKDSEIESLNMRLKLASSQGDNASRLAQQATKDAHDRLKLMESAKDIEIQQLETRLGEVAALKSELEQSRHDSQEKNRGVKQMEAELYKESQIAAKLRQNLAEKEKEIQRLGAAARSHQDSTDRIDRLELALNDKVIKIAELEKSVQAKDRVDEDVRRLRQELQSKERIDEDVKRLRQELQTKDDEVEQKQLEIDDQHRQMESLQQTLEDREAELNVLRVTPDEPETQIEGMQSILRHRDDDLSELRSKILGLEKELGSLQRVADDRLRNLEDLKAELAETKQNLEDEIEILENSLDEAEGRIKDLGLELQSSKSIEREKIQLQLQIKELQMFQDVADAERESLQATVEKLRKDVRAARETANAVEGMSILPEGTSAQIRSLRVETSDLRMRLEAADAKLRTADSKHRTALQRTVAQKDEQMRNLEAEFAYHQRAVGGKASSLQSADLEKKHIAEVKGLAKQIQVLRARLGREKMFRGELAFQKRWFMMMVDMYDACNASNIRMIEQMGISPDPRVKHRPTLKVAAQAVVFCLRLRKASEAWAEQKRAQEALVQKMESMRATRTGGYANGVNKRAILRG